MVVIKRNADATEEQTFEDLSKVDPADLLKFVTVVGVLAADPNSEATGQIELTEPGDYAIVDLLAKGTTTAPASPDPMAIPTGVPNVADGMWTTFTVDRARSVLTSARPSAGSPPEPTPPSARPDPGRALGCPSARRDDPQGAAA